MTEREALREALRLYWDEGCDLELIDDYLFEECGQSISSIKKIMQYLGEAIARFGSDVGSDYIDRRIST